MIRAYYNDHDKNVCLWLEQLIKNGDITKGDVDDRSITEIKPEDIAGYDRVHLFAGIGTWDYALNQSGWGDKPVLTASLPCQPFSAAGKGLGKSDERHLLPAAIDLIIKSGIDTIFGEQVERAIAHGWLDDLQTIMEAEGYAIGHCVLGAHSVNSANIRQRLYWVANSDNTRSQGREIYTKRKDEQPSGSCGLVGWMGNAEYDGRIAIEKCGSDVQTSDARREKGENFSFESKRASASEPAADLSERKKWDKVDWIYCRDGKYRPIKSGIQPLVDGLARGMVHSSDPSAQIEANCTQEARTMRLKGYGNAIQAQTAEAFIRAYMSI